MPERSTRSQRRSLGFLYVLIALLALAAIVLVCAIVYNERYKPVEAEIETTTVDDAFVDVKNLPHTEVVLKADTYRDEYLPDPEGDAATPEPSTSATPRPTLDSSNPAAALRPEAANENLLPVFKKANTEQKVIAITLDDCSGATITQQFIDMAIKYNAKLTLFPTGDNVLKNGMQGVLQKALFSLGYEIENRGYTGMAKLFRYPQTMMVQEIWKQSMALNYVLGVRYQPHFFRMYGGQGETDPRTHAYLKQEGYYGVAHWTVNGSTVSAKKMESKLTPGGIYIFKTTKEDGERMQALMDAAKSYGYKMVTLNELFGYPANTYERIQGSLLAESQPDFDYDDTQLYDLYPGDTAWAVIRLQERLEALGYLVGSKADGIFGEATSEALRMFQATIGKAASGAGDVATLERLYADDAPINPKPIIIETPTPGPGELLVEGELLPSDDFGVTEPAETPEA